MVISALKDRNLPQNRNEIAAAFHDRINSTMYVEWVQEHLNSDTLLSQEELEL